MQYPKVDLVKKQALPTNFLFTSGVGFAHETAYHVSEISLKAKENR